MAAKRGSSVYSHIVTWLATASHECAFENNRVYCTSKVMQQLPIVTNED